MTTVSIVSKQPFRSGQTPDTSLEVNTISECTSLESNVNYL